MRLTIRVSPGSKQPAVGGSHDGALVVKVGERAVEGRATAAALAALADALGVPRSTVILVRGATSRTKVVDIQGDEAWLRTRIGELERNE